MSESTEPETFRGYRKQAVLEPWPREDSPSLAHRLTLSTTIDDRKIAASWVIPEWEAEMATIDLMGLAWEHLADKLDHALGRDMAES